MAKPRPNAQQIYSEYLLAMLLGNPVYQVSDRHKLSRRGLYFLIERIESKQRFSELPHCRKQIWEQRYAHMWELVKTKPLHRAVVKDLYRRSGFDIKEISRYTGLSQAAVKVCLFE